MTQAPPPRLQARRLPPTEPPVVDWYDAELPMRRALVADLQRLARRAASRPLLILIVAGLMTGAVVTKLLGKHAAYEASVVLALEENNSHTKAEDTIPVNKLKEYVESVWLPNIRLLQIIEAHDLSPLRKKLGNEYALQELRDGMELRIFQNWFLDWQVRTGRSARIGITYTDSDPNLAFEVAHELGAAIIETSAEQQQQAARGISDEVKAYRAELNRRLAAMERERAEATVQLALATPLARSDTTNQAQLDLARANREIKKLGLDLDKLGLGTEDAALDATRAGLGIQLSIVQEERPVWAEQRRVVLVGMAVIVFAMMLFVVAMFVGTFDSRIHEADDISRLGLPVLGHLPAFPGHKVGSLRARGVRRRRVAFFPRWPQV